MVLGRLHREDIGDRNKSRYYMGNVLVATLDVMSNNTGVVNGALPAVQELRYDHCLSSRAPFGQWYCLLISDKPNTPCSYIKMSPSITQNPLLMTTTFPVIHEVFDIQTIKPTVSPFSSNSFRPIPHGQYFPSIISIYYITLERAHAMVWYSLPKG